MNNILEQIAAQALTVRLHQREYFRTRTQQKLRRSRMSEALLDQLLAQWVRETASLQPTPPQYEQQRLRHEVAQ